MRKSLFVVGNKMVNSLGWHSVYVEDNSNGTIKVTYEDGPYAGQTLLASPSLTRLDVPIRIVKQKLTRLQRRQARVERIRQQPIAYYVAGWLLAHPTYYDASAPLGEQTDLLTDELIAAGMWPTTIGNGKSLAAGRKVAAVTKDFGEYVADSLEAATGVKAPHRGLGTTDRSLNAKEFVLDFLGGDLNFQMSDVQDVTRILSRVPAIFLPAFEQGRRGENIEQGLPKR